MAAVNINEFLKQIEEDFEKLSKDAARKAAKKAQKDIVRQADKFVSDYYFEYEPKRYKNRQRALFKLVQDYYKEKGSADGISIEFGVQYDSNKIRDIHWSRSPLHQGGNKWIARGDSGFNWHSQDNGIPEPEWIMQKFLAGLHPSGMPGDNGGTKVGDSPDKKMQYFFDTKLDNLVGNYMYSELIKAVETYL